MMSCIASIWSLTTLLYICAGLPAKASAARASGVEIESNLQSGFSKVLSTRRLLERAESSNICTRWSHQSAIVNGTLYIYGGRSTNKTQQTSDTWNDNFLKIDLTKSWQISSPSLTSVPQPSGGPAVANGYLWNSHRSLFLYGGEFSDNPVTNPVPNMLLEYDIASTTWKNHANPKTSAGENAEPDGIVIQRAAEGAGFSVASLGRAWYFGGHLDCYTTTGWSQSTPRVYLRSLIEYTFPGSKNSGVDDLRDGKTAGNDGTWRNITKSGVQNDAGFPERADGVLTYITGVGKQGILLGLAGGTNTTFTQMNVIDLYDIDSSTWFKQATSGEPPDIRVNPCAVTAAAADGSSYNVYMFGGQNLVPAGQQNQYNDVWILSVPSFIWIKIDQSQQSVPPARAGHSCNVWDGQMIVVGGYVGRELSCDSPGVYVFNLSSLRWTDGYSSISSSAGISGTDINNKNPFSQHLSQLGADLHSGLEGSYGYKVPAVVASVIGGDSSGGATVTAPIMTASAGPLVTGKPTTYNTSATSGDNDPRSGNDGAYKNGNKKNVAAIVTGTIAGLFFLATIYFIFCTWLYRKRLSLFKRYIATEHDYSSSQNEKDFPPRADPSSHGSGIGHSNSVLRRSTLRDSDEDLLSGREPSFWGPQGVFLHPRRSLKVINT